MLALDLRDLLRDHADQVADDQLPLIWDAAARANLAMGPIPDSPVQARLQLIARLGQALRDTQMDWNPPARQGNGVRPAPVANVKAIVITLIGLALGFFVFELVGLGIEKNMFPTVVWQGWVLLTILNLIGYIAFVVLVAMTVGIATLDANPRVLEAAGPNVFGIPIPAQMFAIVVAFFMNDNRVIRTLRHKAAKWIILGVVTLIVLVLSAWLTWVIAQVYMVVVAIIMVTYFVTYDIVRRRAGGHEERRPGDEHQVNWRKVGAVIAGFLLLLLLTGLIFVASRGAFTQAPLAPQAQQGAAPQTGQQLSDAQVKWINEGMAAQPQWTAQAKPLTTDQVNALIDDKLKGQPASLTKADVDKWIAEAQTKQTTPLTTVQINALIDDKLKTLTTPLTTVQVNALIDDKLKGQPASLTKADVDKWIAEAQTKQTTPLTTVQINALIDAKIAAADDAAKKAATLAKLKTWMKIKSLSR